MKLKIIISFLAIAFILTLAQTARASEFIGTLSTGSGQGMQQDGSSNSEGSTLSGRSGGGPVTTSQANTESSHGSDSLPANTKATENSGTNNSRTKSSTTNAVSGVSLSTHNQANLTDGTEGIVGEFTPVAGTTDTQNIQNQSGTALASGFGGNVWSWVAAVVILLGSMTYVYYRRLYIRT